MAMSFVKATVVQITVRTLAMGMAIRIHSVCVSWLRSVYPNICHLVLDQVHGSESRYFIITESLVHQALYRIPNSVIVKVTSAQHSAIVYAWTVFKTRYSVVQLRLQKMLFHLKNKKVFFFILNGCNRYIKWVNNKNY